MKLKKITIKSAKELSKSDMKKVCGGDSISVLCYLGRSCRVVNLTYGTIQAGTCSGKIEGNITTCFCHVPNMSGYIVNNNGLSHCTRS